MKKFKLAEQDFESYYLEDYDPACTFLPTVELSEEMYEDYKRIMQELEGLQHALATLKCTHEGENDETK